MSVTEGEGGGKRMGSGHGMRGKQRCHVVMVTRTRITWQPVSHVDCPSGGEAI